MILAKWSPRTPKIHCARGYFSPWGVKIVKYAKFQYFHIFPDFSGNDENDAFLVKKY